MAGYVLPFERLGLESVPISGFTKSAGDSDCAPAALLNINSSKQAKA